MKDLQELFVHTLKDVYYAEKQIVKALPKMAKKADSAKLRKAFETHLEETKGQIERLEEVFKLCDEKPKGDKCPAIDGIIEEAEELIGEIKDADVRDAAMIGAAQAVEHYEISRYGTLKSWAELLDMPECAKLLDQTLKQEYGADEKLTKLAEATLNREAA